MAPLIKHKLVGLILAMTLMTSVCASLSPSLAGAVAPYGPGYRYCGSFQTGYRVRVYETHMGCKKAMRIQREYWLGPDSRKTVVNGGTGARGYVLLKRFPGWRCGSGSGGGQCSKGLKSAAYQD
jgi:hypothetical protein